MAPEVPDGPLASGAPYWYWLGGRPALDLVNTRRERWRRNVECLCGDEDAVGWLVAADLLPEPAAPPRGLAGEARALREAIDAGVRAALAQEPVDPGALRLIDDWLVLAGSRPALLLADDGLPRLSERAPADSPRRALGMVALDAARMLGTPAERARIRICGSETCSARFYDRSPAGRRRWCSMEACGNVEKARRYRERNVAEGESAKRHAWQAKPNPR
jgi:predicted RNA-binding Zn ribbon-like protein